MVLLVLLCRAIYKLTKLVMRAGPLEKTFVKFHKSSNEGIPDKISSEERTVRLNSFCNPLWVMKKYCIKIAKMKCFKLNGHVSYNH